MAGNKINTKTKGKEEKGKSNNKGITGQNNEESEDPDFALLRKPILTSITGFGQARKIFDFATEELKTLLSNECDILYECKVCRNIFRSLVNFISHKRVYCQEKFNTTVHGHFIKPSTMLSEMLKIKQLEEDYQESLNNNNIGNEPDVDSERIPMTKDLTEIIERLTKKSGEQDEKDEIPQIKIQKIPSSNAAVFQNVDENPSNNMRAQVREINKILSRNVAVLQSDGKFTIKSSVPQESENVIQISDDDDNDDSDILKCKTCGMQFSTQKTLRFHMKYKHVETRLVYPCPDCLEIFSTSWSVYRHLFKVHRKTAAQIRRLRESIQAKAFKMNNPPAFYEKRKNNMKSAVTQKITEEERLDQENQAWMDNMEGDGELPRCGGCGRTFERRAALSAHTHTCQPRNRALARRTPQDGKKIEIQIRKDYNKGPPAPVPLPIRTADINENKINKEKRLISPPQPDEIDKSSEKDSTPVDDEQMEVSEDDQKSNDTTDSQQKSKKSETTSPKPVINLPYAQHAETSNLIALKKKIQPDIDIEKILCKKCDTQFMKTQDLYDHVAEHYKWMRYACKLCNYKHYFFNKLPEHVKVVHKLKGDKYFYFSTVTAIDGYDALELSVDEVNNSEETSPDSRRASRCSSDSSRLSDDSSSSSARVEIGSRKRKMFHSKGYMKRRKEVLDKVREEQKEVSAIGEEQTSVVKSFEENSSDMDDNDDKLYKKNIVDDNSTVASRRSVRRKAKPKNEDFEYDLSNLLKKEAQGYRDSLIVASPKPCQIKKKLLPEIPVNFENKDFCGSLITLSKKAVEISAAHMKITSLSLYTTQKEIKPSPIFVRPMIPKSLMKIDKISPKKDTIDENKDTPNKEDKSNIMNAESTMSTPGEEIKIVATEKATTSTSQTAAPTKKLNGTNDLDTDACVKKLNISSVVPFKFRRQSFELIKNPIINKNISELNKAGMKTKILVIKPIPRNNDGSKPSNTPLKFQTIKLKDSHSTSSENKSSDQVVVVKVPKVKPIDRPVVETSTTNDCSSEQVASNAVTENEPVKLCETMSDTNENNTVRNTVDIENDDIVITENEVIISSEVLPETIPPSDNVPEVIEICETLQSDSEAVTNVNPLADELSSVPT
ncbi:hypothetical protein K1T71_005548 [Dendrolimus kikuchii]|uniref:Uncharacterized protein n=1 Tax=Dendrolimus kikuchii TaxID=765133 RepID=A0ACC1D4F3_9NEOP|nr:hypothetical protein K1T71_005548 [Dendrolimus kikuchii]